MKKSFRKFKAIKFKCVAIINTVYHFLWYAVNRVETVTLYYNDKSSIMLLVYKCSKIFLPFDNILMLFFGGRKKCQFNKCMIKKLVLNNKVEQNRKPLALTITVNNGYNFTGFEIVSNYIS